MYARIVRRWLTDDVLTMARSRVAHIFDVFDHVTVSFSGGKDSLACLHLCKAEAARRGRLPLDAFFYDQEVLPPTVVDFVEAYRREPWLNLRWFAVPIHSHKYILGRTLEFTPWGEDRATHFRPRPPWAETGTPGHVYSFADLDRWIARSYRGSVAVVLGIRAAESIMRFRSCMNKVNENYINASAAPSLKKVKPIYDWQEMDVLKYCDEIGVPLCDVYERQSLIGRALRVHEPMGAEAAKWLHREREIDGPFYDRIVTMFPEMDVQSRYARDVSSADILDKYPITWEGIETYIRTEVAPRDQARAFKMLQACRVIHWKKPDRYPVRHLFRHFVRGGWARMPHMYRGPQEDA